MQSILVNPKITKEKIITITELKSLKNNHQYILYSDNILEGITLLNNLTKNNDILSYRYTVYQPIDQPIYVFSDGHNYYSIKVCGAFDKWILPNDVYAIKDYVDLPDYILYSVKSKKAILAGENTETASVGNSQWQREGRKIAAAKNKVPFIYQTFYSGKDESQDKIREPNSLQAYNHILYTTQYKTPSFVAYFENNFTGAKTRKRTPEDSQKLFSDYIKTILLCDVCNNLKNKKRKYTYEQQFLEHMISYLGEGKFSPTKKTIGTKPRLELDLPTIDPAIKKDIIENKTLFAKDLLDYIYDDNDHFIKKYNLTDIKKGKMPLWNSYSKKKNIKDLLEFLKVKGEPAKSYISRSAKAGIAKTAYCKEFLINKFPSKKTEIESILGNYDETLILPLRIHKKSNGKLTFSPDPESGEIVAFSEFLGYDMNAKKTRPIIGYCIVDTPKKFNFDSKQGTKLYKAIANYVDILILNNMEFISTCTVPPVQRNLYFPNNIEDESPLSTTEETAVVSTYLNQSTIKSNWELCFIHVHHSSWQQILISGKQEKIGRISTKLDLIMQQGNKFMLAEGKNHYQDILRDQKIQRAMDNAGKTIDNLYNHSNIKFDAFLYNLATNPKKDPEYYADKEEKTVKGGIKLGHFNDIAKHNNYVIIIVYVSSSNKTKFKLIFSDNFDPSLRKQLETEFL